jgi:PelA/Pel-15E family pectate lyase
MLHRMLPPPRAGRRSALLALASLLAFVVAPAGLAEPVTAERVAALPKTDQPAWRDYLARSVSFAAADQAALQAELTTLGRSQAVRAPDGGDFKLPEKPNDAWFASEENTRLADVVLSYQTPSGGWSKHTGYSRGPRQPGMLWSSQYEPNQAPHYLATFDNRSTTEQLRFLAGVWRATGREDCRGAVQRGLDFILAAQYPTGGWPQVYPLEGDYHDNITFNDDAMTHVLALLRDIAAGAPTFALIDASRREKASLALQAGTRCLLAAQITVTDRKTVWCAQYDPITLRPEGARKMEPASLSGLESARILSFLMSLPAPDAETVAAIEAGLAWMDQARITNVAKTRAPNGKTVYQIVPSSTEVYWARFYDLQTGGPIFPGRDGVIYDNYEAMIAKNAGGYDYFTTIPGSVVNNGRKKWMKSLASHRPN